MIENFLDLLVVFGCILAGLIGLTHIIILKKKAENIIWGLCLINISLILLRHLLLKYQVAFWGSSALFLYFTLTYLAGPLAFLSVKLIASRDFRFHRRLLIHFSPLILMIGCDIYLATLSETEIASILNGILTLDISWKSSFQFGFFWGMRGICYGAMAFYMALISLDVLSLRRKSEFNAATDLSLIILCITMIAMLLMIAAYFSGSLILRSISIYTMSLIGISLFIYTYKTVDFVPAENNEMLTKKYQKSRLRALNLEQIESELNRLLLENQLYLDENIKLRDLADKLSISQHQLSEFLNNHLNISFKNLINKHRIEKARELLYTNTDMNILTIAYEVGFNSRSTFNAAFSKITGKSPKEFREYHVGRGSGSDRA
jgi:AraC-like DNA-binding protein